MKHKIIYILIILLFIGVLILANISYSEYLNNSPPSGFGNILSSYFFQLGHAIFNKTDFKYDGLLNYDFMENLPPFLKYNYDKIHEEMINAGIDQEWINFTKAWCNNGCAAFEMRHDKTEKFWMIMRPLVIDLLENAFIKSHLVKTVHCPVIHFRCSDAPFIRQNGYNFQKYSFFEKALEKITNNKQKYDSIIILYCNSHASKSDEDKKSCEIYVSNLFEHITAMGYDVKIQCSDILDDFSTIFYAPAVISTGGSFSFMSGFFGKGLFISAGHEFSENDEKNVYLDNIGDWLFKGYNVKHNQISDYNDTEAVLNILHN